MADTLSTKKKKKQHIPVCYTFRSQCIVSALCMAQEVHSPIPRRVLFYLSPTPPSGNTWRDLFSVYNFFDPHNFQVDISVFVHRSCNSNLDTLGCHNNKAHAVLDMTGLFHVLSFQVHRCTLFCRNISTQNCKCSGIIIIIFIIYIAHVL